MKHKAPSVMSVSGTAGRLMATTEGDGGIPIVFIHGNGGDRTLWAEAQQQLTTRTVAFDLRGLGESGGAHGPFGIEAAVEDVLAIADAAVLEKFVLVGHGFGAAVASAFSTYYPERLAGLLYVDAPGDLRGVARKDVDAFLANFTAEKYGSFHEHWFAPLLLEAKAPTRTRVMNALRTSRREAVAANEEALFGHDPTEAFKSFIGPTHALAASNAAETLVAQQPTLSRSMAPHASHWLMLDSPQWFHSELVQFLGRCRHH